MAEERALDDGLAGQVDHPFQVPDPLGPGQRAVRADQAKLPASCQSANKASRMAASCAIPAAMASRRGRAGGAAVRARLVLAGLVRCAAWSLRGLVPGAPVTAAWFPVVACGRGSRATRRTATDAPPRHVAVIAAARQDSSRSIMWRAPIPAAGSCLASPDQPSVPRVQQTLRLRPLTKERIND